MTEAPQPVSRPGGRTWWYADLAAVDQPRNCTRRLLTSRQYLGFVAITSGLAVAQFYFLPRNLGPTQFATAVLALSVIQGAQQLGDFGAHNASLRAGLPRADRIQLRESAVLLSTVTCLIGILTGVVVGLSGSPFGYLVALACGTALLLAPSKAHSSGAIQLGDERAATMHNLVWQNASKFGSIVGSFGGTALLSILGALINATLLYRPALPRFVAWAVLKAHARVILPGLALSVSAFFMMWIDTYTLSSVTGLADAGQYQAVVRPLTGITYLYLPVISLIQAAHNAGLLQRERRLMVVASMLGVGGSFGIAVGLYLVGERIWPAFDFAPEVVAACGAAAGLAALSAVVGGQLTLRGRQGWAAANTVLGALVLLLLSLLLIPRIGAVGAGLASAAAWLLVALCHAVVLWWTLRSPTLSPQLPRHIPH